MKLRDYQLDAERKTLDTWKESPSAQAKGCMTCKGRGFISKWYWTTCTPEEVRKLRES